MIALPLVTAATLFHSSGRSQAFIGPSREQWHGAYTTYPLDMDEKVPRIPRAAQLAVVLVTRLRGGVPEAITCAEALASPRQLRRVTDAVFKSLSSMEEYQRQIGDDEREIFAMLKHFPGPRELEPIAREACEGADRDKRAMLVVSRAVEGRG
jgi:hypothetical protein